jgi:23S rRNA (uracil1939-C5)-methyltransferase
VLTPFVIPGETALVEPQREKAGLVRARLVEVTAASPQRADPPCPYFFRCGGCQYQHAAYDFQAAQKSEILREQLKRVGRIDYTDEIRRVTGPPLGYRNRTQLHIERGRIGYFADGTHTLVPMDHCPISSPRINDAIRELAAMARDRRFPAFVKGIELFTNETETLVNVIESEQPVARRFFEWCAERIPGAALGVLQYVAGEFTFQVSHNSFFQVNRFLLDQLVQASIGAAEGGQALDLYAGVGLFSLHLARRFQRVTAVESGKSAVHDLAANAQRAGLDIGIVHGNVEQFLPSLEAAPDFVLADPPRSGLGRRVVDELARLRPARIAIVACDPATLARDLGGLTAAGYRIEELWMIDLFPQTYHLETIARLTCL